jgi:hypothetical protein
MENIDFDEFGVTLEKCNHMGGWAGEVKRIQKEGHYHHGTKILSSLLSSQEIWTCCHMLEGVLNVFDARSNVYVRLVPPPFFLPFCDYVCRDIETNNIPGTGFRRIFIWDNLAAHHSQYVHNTVTDHVILAILPLSCCFCTIQTTALMSTRSAR